MSVVAVLMLYNEEITKAEGQMSLSEWGDAATLFLDPLAKTGGNFTFL